MSADDNFKSMRRAMARELKDLLGSGYVDEYYFSHASGFVNVAEWYAERVAAEAIKTAESA